MRNKKRTPLKAGRPSAKKPAKSLKDLQDKQETVRLTIDVTEEQRIKLKIASAQEGKSIAAYIREFIDYL